MSKIADATASISSHSLPWTTRAWITEPDRSDWIEDARGRCVCIGLSEANARLIVQAVNSFEAMRDALQTVAHVAKEHDYELILRHGGELGLFLTKEQIEAVMKALKLAGEHNAD